MSKIELWINEEVADLDNEAIILFNYAMEDLTNPAIVKNSYTQTVSLQGTPTNNRIFSHIYREDRLTRSGFNPQERTPFRIVKDGELLESGYLKLDKVDKNGAKLTYNVTLYGGLGSFFYALAYRADGEKKTLADLDYIGDGSKISYTLTAFNVSDAWGRIGKTYDHTNKWHTLNFAPCIQLYSGIQIILLFPNHTLCQSELNISNHLIKSSSTPTLFCDKIISKLSGMFIDSCK